MKKIIFIFMLILFTANTSFAQNNDLSDFKKLDRYIETFEINDEIPNTPENTDNDITDEEFEQQAIENISKRYEENAVELKLDDVDDSALSDVNGERLFKLKVNETQYNIEQNIKAENMIWDGSKAFTNAFLSNSKHMAPIPAVVNSQSIEAKVSPSLSASFGQTYLNDAVSTSVLFVRTNESTYNTGSVISYKGESVNLAVGSFSSSFNNAASGGAILASNPLKLPKNSGSFMLGSAFFTKEGVNNDKTTGGFFGEYQYKRLKLNAQIGQSRYSDNADYDTSVYFIPEFRISDSLYLKTRFIRNVSQDTMQDELALTYKPKKSLNNFEFEINASNQYDKNSTIKQRLKLSTTFRI